MADHEDEPVRDPLLDVLDSVAEQERELLSAAESIYDGWYAGKRIDWDHFLDLLEGQTGVDLGESLDSPLIRRIKAHIRKYAKS